ncbi:conserved hypothetical protein [uncultured Desulfobacterium sp.]|uniref:TonB-dependent receptor n=1 Tax=uncultured Desulfobacterium sp. TaxID=201089 RepID=A0A445MXE5_9BACT|nr:conserved hypothetical protein [uncultured Desulfobacterium sp.]
MNNFYEVDNRNVNFFQLINYKIFECRLFGDMTNHRIKKCAILSLFFLIFFIVGSYKTCNAQSEEETEFLQMFYKDKDLVISPTRNPKPISEVAENITVITKNDIEMMNAHTVSEVLNSVPGLFISFNQDFGAFAQVSIQGSEPRHVLVVVDDVPWNSLLEGAAASGSIPVGIIERIEIIKGPASSTWGSSLGGVINIITKPAGTTETPTGTISGSYGERQTQDYRIEAAGKLGPAGYYLYLGRQDSDGLRNSRCFETNNLYSKFNITLSDNADLGLTMGYSNPEVNFGGFPSLDIRSSGLLRAFFTTAFLNMSFNPEMDIKISVRRFEQKAVQDNEVLGLGYLGLSGQPYLGNIYDEATTGASTKLTWSHGFQSVVLGMDYAHGKLEQTINAGPFLQTAGVPVAAKAHPDIDKYAVFFNDTFDIDNWSITPGIRYDYNDITGSFLSPSLGVAYRLGRESILRTSVARGFTIPPLASTSSGGLFLDPNSSLDPEDVWSYQVGAESGALHYAWIKATLFYHDLKHSLTKEPYGGGPPLYNDIYINNGKVRREGLELEMETLPFHNFSFLAGSSYVDIRPYNENGSKDRYTYLIGIRYDNKKTFKGQVTGQYVWWDLGPAYGAKYDDFIWNFNLNKKIWSKQNCGMELFFSGHNIFDGAQYTFVDSKNPDRWVETGIKFYF